MEKNGNLEEKEEMPYLTVGNLRKMIEGLPEDMEVFIRACSNPCGNILHAGIVSKDTRGFFGISIDCIIIEPHESYIN